MGIKNWFITYSTRIKRKNELILNVLPEMDDNFTTSNPTFNRYPSSGQEVSSRSGTVSGFNRIASGFNRIDLVALNVVTRISNNTCFLVIVQNRNIKSSKIASYLLH